MNTEKVERYIDDIEAIIKVANSKLAGLKREIAADGAAAPTRQNINSLKSKAARALNKRQKYRER